MDSWHDLIDEIKSANVVSTSFDSWGPWNQNSNILWNCLYILEIVIILKQEQVKKIGMIYEWCEWTEINQLSVNWLC